MLKKFTFVVLGISGLIVVYFLFWPVPIDPVAWEAPPNPGYSGPYAPNERLRELEKFPLDGLHGPEDIALDAQGRIYVPTHEGIILRLHPDGSNPERWADTGGRPLGIDFDGAQNLIVADAYRGLLSIAPNGSIQVLASQASGLPIVYADDVDVAEDGRIYFSDATTKFSAKASGGTLQGSLLDLMEHGGHGRLLVYDPSTGKATTVMDGLNFANGVAVSHDQQYVLITETGGYRVFRHWISGGRAGEQEVLIDTLPGFPDNISTGRNGRFWIAFASPRNSLLDGLSGFPFLRKMVQRLPAFLRPKPVLYGHVIAIDGQGRVVADLQDPEGRYPITTAAVETETHLYIGSLVAPVLGRVEKPRLGW